MNKPRICAFTVADAQNLPYAEKMVNSLRKFHSKEELPCDIIGPERLDLVQDPQKFYRMTPMIAKDLIRQFDVVIKLDADQIITGDLSHVWEGDFDIACVNNSNPREMEKMRVQVWDIHPLAYLNCGFVVMKSTSFIDHWWKLSTSSHFANYQYREQDLMNIMCFYGDYKVRLLDQSNKFHGLISKGYWSKIELRDEKLVLPRSDEWPKDEDKEIVCIHLAGGNDPTKWNLRTRFNPEVYKRLEWLTKSG